MIKHLSFIANTLFIACDFWNGPICKLVDYLLDVVHRSTFDRAMLRLNSKDGALALVYYTRDIPGDALVQRKECL